MYRNKKNTPNLKHTAACSGPNHKIACPSITQMIFVMAGNNCKEHSFIQYENSILENFNNHLEFLGLNKLFWSLQHD